MFGHLGVTECVLDFIITPEVQLEKETELLIFQVILSRLLKLISGQAGVEYLKCVAQQAAMETVEVERCTLCHLSKEVRATAGFLLTALWTPDLLDQAPSSLSAVWPPKTLGDSSP